MGIVTTIKRAVGMDTGDEGPSYECRTCGTRFDTDRKYCESCGGDRMLRVE